MATILRNSDFHNLRETIKGDVGEDIVRNLLEECNFVVYQAITEKAHLVDFIVQRDMDLIFAVEVKTKPKFKKYPATGFDYRHYQRYRDFSKKSRLPVLIVFVDIELKNIYGNFLHVLDEPRTYCNMNYPGTFKKNGITIRYYPLNAMIDIAPLTEKDITHLVRS